MKIFNEINAKEKSLTAKAVNVQIDIDFKVLIFKKELLEHRMTMKAEVTPDQIEQFTSSEESLFTLIPSVASTSNSQKDGKVPE